MKTLNSLIWHLFRPMHRKAFMVALASILAVACAGQQPATDDQPYEPTFQEKVAECSKIADRSERDHCLYGN